MRWHRGLRRLFSPRPIETHNRPARRVLLQLEELETRALLSASLATDAASDQGAHPLLTVTPQSGGVTQQTSAVSGYTPQQIQQAYGFDQLAPVNGKAINGAGQTIAIVDAFYDPNITSDANTFSSQFNLPLFNSSGGPTLTVVASGGGSASGLSQDSTGAWPLETSLDVEWAHAMAPQANIVLVEAPGQDNTSIFNAVQYASSLPGVSVVSMSWGDYEFSGETAYDPLFQPKSSSNPNGANPGVTFVAASGDEGAMTGPIYPATSPYVLAVGGTTLGGSTSSTGGYGTTGGFGSTGGFGTTGFFGTSGFGTTGFFGTSGFGTFASYGFGYSAFARAGGGLYSSAGSLSIAPAASTSGSTAYPGESAWSGSGGGASSYEGEPSYQYNQQSINDTFGFPNVETYNYATGTYSYYYSRMTPDVAYNADPNSGYAIYDSIASPDYGTQAGWNEVGGTSAAAPQWAAIVALADQERSLNPPSGGTSTALDTNQVQSQLYNSLSNGNYANIFHDVTTGSNGYSAGTDYDLATGLGSPIANNLIPYLASTTIPLGQLPTIQGSGYGGSGTTGAGFGTTFTSFGGFAASSRAGEGLYSGSGSLSLPPASQGVALNGQAAATPATAASGTASSLLAPLATPLASSLATVNAASSVPTGASNFVGNLSSLAPTSPVAPTNGNIAQAVSSNASAVQDSATLGASGWNGAALAWHLSTLGLPGQQLAQPADNLFGDGQDDGDDPATEDASDSGADGSGELVSVLDVTAPPLLDGDGGGGDGGE